MSTLAADLRYGLRTLLAAPRVTLTAVLSLALGIGAATAIFTVVHAVILRPLPYAEPDRLVALWETTPEVDRRPVAAATFLDWRRDARAFADVAAYDLTSVSLTGRERPERLRAASVSGTFWSLLGVRALVGRTFTAAEDEAGAEPAAVLGHGAWLRLFGGDAGAIGRTLLLDGRPHTLVGVLPPAFDFFGPDVDVITSGDRAVPRSFPGVVDDITQNRDSHYLNVVGRLRDDATVASAQAELTTIMQRLEAAYPETNTGLGARVVPLHDDVVAEARPALLLLLGAVAFLLLIACVNVANLLLARAVARQREMAVRASLGAGRARLVRQLLTETALLGLAGGAAGLLLAWWGVPALIALAPEGLPRAGSIGIDPMTLAVTAGVSLGSALLVGLLPALHATSARGGQGLQVDGHRTSGSRSGRRVQGALVVAELALAQVLLAGAGLLITSFVKVQHVDLGFSPDRLVAAELTMPAGKYDAERKLAFNRAILEKLEALPGVRGAAATLTVPLRGAINRGIWFLDRPEPPPGQQPAIDFMIVSPGYFRTLGIPIVAGRAFTGQDRAGAPRVAVVSQAAARRFWPGGTPIGRRVRFGGTEAEIVGIVGDVRQRDPARAPEPLLYIPDQQDAEPWNFIAFALRVQGDPASLAPAIRDAVLAVDPDQPVARIRTLDEIAGALLAGRRFNTVLLTAFAAAALLLAAIGTYGVMRYAVTRRTREIGVRMALGARPADVLRLVLGQGAALVALAVGLGLAGALASTRLLAQQLFEVRAADPGALLAGAATLGAVALVACYLPARRAMTIHPVEAIRTE